MFNFFRRLQWKLTLSYTIATVGTVIVLAALLVGIAMYSESQVTTRVFDSFYWSKTAFQDNIPYLIEDPANLQDWLERVQKDGFGWMDFQSYTVRESLDYANTLVTGLRPIYVLDPDLNLIAAAPLDHPSEIGKPFNPRRPNNPGLESILDAALVGDKNYTAQSYTLPDGSYVVAFPLRKTDNDPVVAIVIYTLRPIAFATPTNLSVYTTFFIIISLVMLMVTLPVGSVFGWLASRGLRKRLGTLSTAARAWSKGDFSAAPRDGSADEIGELTRNLTNMADQLQTLLHARDELARVEERNRLARDLHDTVKQQAFALNLQLATLRRQLGEHPESGRVEQAQALSQQIQRELVQLLDELRAGDAELPFVERLRARAQAWSQTSGIALELQLGDVFVSPPDVADNLLRIVDEALANVLRHSGATQVMVSLHCDAADARLVVADNGRGADAPLRPGMGLANMRERAQALPQGRFAFDSAAAHGTNIRIAFSIAKETSA